MPARFHPDVAIDNCSGITSAVFFSVAGNAKGVAIGTNIVGLQAHLEAFDAGISTYLIEVKKEARLGPVIVVLCVVAIGLLLFVDDLLMCPEPVIAPPSAAVRGIDGSDGSNESNCELHVS